MGMAPEWLVATLNRDSIPAHDLAGYSEASESFDEELPAPLAKNA